MIARAPALLVGAAAICAALIPAAGAEQSAARVIDETYLCKVAVHNGVRKLSASARRGFRDDGRWRWLASVGVANDPGGPPAKLPPTSTGNIPVSYKNWGFGAFAGLDLAYPEPSPPLEPYRAGVSVTPRRACAASRARVQLARRGLDGFSADYFGDEVKCSAPTRVLVRVRAVFASPTSLRLDPSQGALRSQRASGAVREVELAVRATSGRPLVYASASSVGGARLFSAAGCTST